MSQSVRTRTSPEPSASTPTSTIHQHDRQTTPFRFLDLPAGKRKCFIQFLQHDSHLAELRNNIYKFFVLAHEHRGRGGRLLKNRKVYWGCLNATSDNPRLLRKADSTQPVEPVYGSLVSLSRVSKQLRAEYFPLLTAHLHIGVASKDLQQFLHAFCHSISSDETSATACPKSLIVYMPDRLAESDSLRCESIDLLPLIKLRTQIPRFTCVFKSMITTKEANLARKPGKGRRKYQPWPALELEASDIAVLISCDTVEWQSLIQGEKLSQVLLRPYHYRWGKVVELVFHAQPAAGRRLDGENMVCYLPDVRRLGLESVYHNTGLVFAKRLNIQTALDTDQI